MQSYKKVFLGNVKFSSEERIDVKYENEVLEKVDIFGSVVSLLEKEKCFIFKLDDMTGIVECVKFKNENDNDDLNSCGKNKSASQKFLETLKPVKNLQLGDIVNVRGKAKVYKCKFQITCNNIHNYLTEIRQKSVCESNSLRLEKRSISFNSRRENFDKVFKRIQTPDIEEFKKLCKFFTREKQKKDLERIHLGLSCGLPFIKVFLDTNGALYSVIGCLSGVNTNRQMQALYCVINLGLGNEDHCYKVCKKVGSYLVSCMASQNPQIQGYCCWAFGNFCLGNPGVCSLMMSQGFEEAVVNVFSCNNPFALQWAAYSLNFYIKTTPKRIPFIFTPCVIKELSLKFSSYKENVPNLCWCLFLLSTEQTLCNWLINYGIVGSALQILHEMAEKNNMDIMIFTALLRLITNCVAFDQTLSIEICYKVDVFVPIIKFSLKSPNIHNEVMQLIANIVNGAMMQPITGENVLEDSNLKGQLEPVLRQSLASMFLSHKPDFQFNNRSQ